MIKRQKIFFFFSNVIDSPIYRALLIEFSSNEFELHCIFLGQETLPLYDYACTLSIVGKHYSSASKRDIVQQLLLNMFLLAKNRPRFIFTFGQTASIIGLVSAVLTCKAKRINLRMHTSMNKVENFPRGILYDRISNWLAHTIVVPNSNTEKYLITKERVPRRKIMVVAFGFDIRDLAAPSSERIQEIERTYALSPGQFVIGIVSRFTPMKGLQYSLPAVTDFLNRNPDATLLLAGVGNIDSPELTQATARISPNQIRIIPRVNDMAAFYGCLDVFIHTPIDETVESFGLVYVEAFAAGVPSIITLSGIAKDIASPGVNCLVVQYRNVEEIGSALEALSSDKDVSLRISTEAKKSVSAFTLESMCQGYRNLIDES